MTGAHPGSVPGCRVHGRVRDPDPVKGALDVVVHSRDGRRCGRLDDALLVVLVEALAVPHAGAYAREARVIRRLAVLLARDHAEELPAVSGRWRRRRRRPVRAARAAVCAVSTEPAPGSGGACPTVLADAVRHVICATPPERRRRSACVQTSDDAARERRGRGWRRWQQRRRRSPGAGAAVGAVAPVGASRDHVLGARATVIAITV